ncbi:hypothetical protein [Lactobacillus gasseri]|jgi:hypothetical protein|uniref:hypothetical protein n=1 Tax=Lactobacillus gasseri TaxID=1596 RepID=UPI0029C13461|nr:hypothetical protein [Lactobacillus gasseri]MDX5065817.1 hypothetical protein [Lactobacillus gasseri]MDX5082518.1 hypothetical protein [Lactobacillus gasseri]
MKKIKSLNKNFYIDKSGAVVHIADHYNETVFSAKQVDAIKLLIKEHNLKN